MNNQNNTNELPRNLNFLFVLIILFLIMVICAVILTIYNVLFDYNKSVELGNIKIYYPMGFTPELKTDGNYNTCAFIYNKSTSYEFCKINSKYENYKYNNYQTIYSSLSDQGFKVQNIEEYDDNLILIEYDGKEHYNSIYVYKFNDNEVITGYFVKSSTVYQKDINTLQKMLANINKE